MQTMKPKNLTAIGIVLLFSVLYACKPSECHNTNPVLNANLPGSPTYKAELAKLLKATDPAKLTYWFHEYLIVNGQEMLRFEVKGDKLCALLELNVDNWTRLETLRKKQGVTFRGAEFKDLKYDIRQDSTHTEFVFKNYSEIID